MFIVKRKFQEGILRRQEKIEKRDNPLGSLAEGKEAFFACKTIFCIRT